MTPYVGRVDIHDFLLASWGAGAVFVQKGVYDAFMDLSKGTTPYLTTPIRMCIEY